MCHRIVVSLHQSCLEYRAISCRLRLCFDRLFVWEPSRSLLAAIMEPRQPVEPPSAAAIAAQAAAVEVEDDEVHEPQGVTIVSFGYQQKSGKDWLEDAADVFTVVDAREYLKRDPSSAVGHEQNGTFLQTQQVVFSQAGIVELLEQLTEFIDSGDTDKLGVGCRMGMHRADTVCRALEDSLNMMVDAEGRRLYNAKHFGLTSALGRKGYLQMLTEAKKWSRQPWVVMEGGPQARRNRFGYQGCSGSEAASKNWNAFHDWLDASYHTLPTPPALLPPPPPPPQAIEVKEEEAEGEAEAEAAERERIVQAALTAGAETSSQDSRKRGRTLEPWETFSRDASVWVDVLSDAGVDKVARQELFLLAQHSDAGFGEANSIIGKLLKKAADRDLPRNASAFVHSCVCKARGDIGSWSYYGGSSSSSSAPKGGKGKGKDKSKRW